MFILTSDKVHGISHPLQVYHSNNDFYAKKVVVALPINGQILIKVKNSS